MRRTAAAKFIDYFYKLYFHTAKFHTRTSDSNIVQTIFIITNMNHFTEQEINKLIQSFGGMTEDEIVQALQILAKAPCNLEGIMRSPTQYKDDYELNIRIQETNALQLLSAIFDFDPEGQKRIKLMIKNTEQSLFLAQKRNQQFKKRFKQFKKKQSYAQLASLAQIQLIKFRLKALKEQIKYKTFDKTVVIRLLSKGYFNAYKDIIIQMQRHINGGQCIIELIQLGIQRINKKAYILRQQKEATISKIRQATYFLKIQIDKVRAQMQLSKYYIQIYKKQMRESFRTSQYLFKP